MAKAASDILIGKSFDHGVLCSSPNSVVVDAVIADETKRQFQAQGGYFLTAAEADVLARALVTPQRLPNPKFVGQSALNIANALGFSVPAGTRALIAELKGAGRDYPLDREALSRALLRRGRLAGRLRAVQTDSAVRRHGPHHVDSFDKRSDHSRVRPQEAGIPHLRQHAHHARIHRAEHGLDPAMTLGCGGFGGNITSDTSRRGT